MTAYQKENISKLRKSGVGYDRIATALNIPEGTIKSFCRRNNLGGHLTSPDSEKILLPTFCKQCGNLLNQNPKCKVKIFCSFTCRMAWWKVHPEQINRKAVYSFTCPICETGFNAYGNKKRKFCSHACYINARFGVNVKADAQP